MKYLKECLGLQEQKESFVLVTMLRARGSSPQDPGAKMLVTQKGLYAGTIGGGKVEMAAITKAQDILKSTRQADPEVVCWNLQRDIGMSCGGEVEFLFEHHHAQSWPIVIFGAGHVAQALTRLLSHLNCQVSCIDSRSEWVERLDGVRGIHHPSPKELVKTFSGESFFLCMTMGHAHDVPILQEIALHHPEAPYVGVIGSEIKGLRIKQELKQLGIQENFLSKLRVPMGLDLGSNAPWEIAISIAAELLQTRDQRPPRSA
jgi:xanthine dehydrogenase accessory factor